MILRKENIDAGYTNYHNVQPFRSRIKDDTEAPVKGRPEHTSGTPGSVPKKRRRQRSDMGPDLTVKGLLLLFLDEELEDVPFLYVVVIFE